MGGASGQSHVSPADCRPGQFHKRQEVLPSPAPTAACRLQQSVPSPLPGRSLRGHRGAVSFKEQRPQPAATQLLHGGQAQWRGGSESVLPCLGTEFCHLVPSTVLSISVTSWHGHLMALRWLQHLCTSRAHVSLSRGRKWPVSSRVSLFKETDPVQKHPQPAPYLSQVTNDTRPVLYQLRVRGTERP